MGAVIAGGAALISIGVAFTLLVGGRPARKLGAQASVDIRRDPHSSADYRDRDSHGPQLPRQLLMVKLKGDAESRVEGSQAREAITGVGLECLGQRRREIEKKEAPRQNRAATWTTDSRLSP